MPILSNAMRQIRTSGKNPARKQESAHWDWGSSVSRTGVAVSDDRALSLTAVRRGIELIASTIGGLPIHVYERQGDTTKQIEPKDAAYLWYRPNVEWSRPGFWEMLVSDEVQGNAVIFVEKDRSGGPASLWRINPSRVKAGRTSDGRKVYEIDNELPMIDYRQGGEIVHVPNLSRDGIWGMNPLRIAAESVGLGLAAEEYAARFFSQASAPRGLISTEQSLTKEQADTLAASWERSNSGLSHAHRTAVMGNGAKFQATSISPYDTQLYELRRFQLGEVSRILGIPPHLLGDVERTSSWGAGIEEQNRGFVSYTLQAHINRFEAEINDALLVKELSGRFVKFDLRGLLRGSTLQRYQAYAVGWGRWLTTNDIRQLEDEEPVEGGDKLMQPVNMAPMDAFEGMKIGQNNGNSAHAPAWIEVRNGHR